MLRFFGLMLLAYTFAAFSAAAQNLPQQNLSPHIPQQQSWPQPQMPVPQVQRPCTQIGCNEGLLINLPPISTPGQYRLLLVADGVRYLCTGTLPLKPCGQASSVCDRAGIFVGESGCALPPTQHRFNSVLLPKVPKNVAVEFTMPGRQPLRRAGRVQPQCFYPNGPQCDARPCCQAQFGF